MAVGSYLPRTGQPFKWARFSPNGEYIVTADKDRKTRIWDTSGHNILTYGGHTDTVWTAEFSPDGKYVVTASSDGTARIFPATVSELVASSNRFLAALPHAITPPTYVKH